MVYNADGNFRRRAKKIGLSHTGISRRISTRPFFARGGTYNVSLCCRSRPRRQVDEECLGLTRHPSKGVWTGKTVIEHLGVQIDSVEMKFFIAERKVQKVMQL